MLMPEYDELARAAQRLGKRVFWFGAATVDQINRLEELVGVTLPASFRRFLASYGGGGVVGVDVSGIEGNDAAKSLGGTVIGDTRYCRAQYGLPAHLVVVYFHDDDVCWCLDTSRYVNDECPVVHYNLFTRKVDKTIAPDFAAFMRQHLSLYGQPD